MLQSSDPPPVFSATPSAQDQQGQGDRGSRQAPYTPQTAGQGPGQHTFHVTVPQGYSAGSVQSRGYCMMGPPMAQGSQVDDAGMCVH